jgi:hypothetical protein
MRFDWLVVELDGPSMLFGVLSMVELAALNRLRTRGDAIPGSFTIIMVGIK